MRQIFTTGQRYISEIRVRSSLCLPTGVKIRAYHRDRQESPVSEETVTGKGLGGARLCRNLSQPWVAGLG